QHLPRPSIKDAHAIVIYVEHKDAAKAFAHHNRIGHSRQGHRTKEASIPRVQHAYRAAEASDRVGIIDHEDPICRGVDGQISMPWSYHRGAKYAAGHGIKHDHPIRASYNEGPPGARVDRDWPSRTSHPCHSENWISGGERYPAGNPGG